jgi:ABC-type nitrate/sulfonate/bicarbonate transport system substrate-binding protein
MAFARQPWSDQMALELTRRGFGEAALSGLTASVFGAPTRAVAAESKLIFQADWLNDPEFLGYMIAIDNGYYKAEGLSVEYLSGGPSLIPEGVLLSGKADVALTNSLTTAKAIFEKSAPLVVIGTQYQKSPLGVISLASKNISSLKDLIGKTIACPTISESVLVAALKLANIPQKDVRIVPYAFDPTPLINGDVDAVADFVTQLPFLVEQKSGQKVSSFLFWDVGLPLYMDLLVVTKDTLKSRRPDLVKFLRASRQGWKENFADPKKYPPLFDQTWFNGLGSTPEAELYFNSTQLGLMENPKGFFSMSEADIKRNLEALAGLSIKATAEMFDTSLLAEL